MLRPMEQTHTIVAKEGWSWGAFGTGPAFLIAVKRYKFLWWYLLFLIPFVNFIFMLAFAIYLGVNGRKIAAAGKQFANQSEYDGYMKGVDHAGKVMFFVGVIVGAIIFILFIVVILFAAVFAPKWSNSSSSSSTAVIAGPGERCGGNMMNAPICDSGYTCAPDPSSHLPFGDVGGICVLDASSSAF